MRADERRVILNQYRDVLAQMDLPPATASRLQNLLTERIEAVLDAEDAAVREGFAEGSTETVRTVTLAMAEVDREITNLVGRDGSRLLDDLVRACRHAGAGGSARCCHRCGGDASCALLRGIDRAA